jgi:hypothetical protein
LHTGFLLGLFFDHEDGGNMVLQNISWLSVDYTALYPEDRTLHKNILYNRYSQYPKTTGKHNLQTQLLTMCITIWQ